MKCPHCKNDVPKLLVGGLCPTCKAPLRYVKKQDVDGSYIKILEFRKLRDSSNTEDSPEVYDTIYNVSNVKIEKSTQGNRYIVTYDRISNFNWIYCPHCESKMFQNNIMRGSQEHKCHKCKSTTTYIFN